MKERMNMTSNTISDRMDQVMKEIYYEDGIVIGRDALHQLVNERLEPEGIYVPRQTVRDWLRQQEVYQLYYQQRGNSKVGHFPLTLPFTNISVDLIDKAQKGGVVRFLLVCVDNFSRYVYVQKLANKQSSLVAEKMKVILDKIDDEFGRKDAIRICFHDQGSEFRNEFQKLMDDNNIRVQRSVAQVPSSNGLVERVIGTIKRLYTKRQRVKGESWFTHVDDAVRIYNEKLVHKSTNFKPIEAAKFKQPENDDEIATLRENVSQGLHEQDLSRKVDQDLQVGDKVRKRTNRNSLSKSSEMSFTERVFDIVEVIPGTVNKEPKYLINDGKEPPIKYRSVDLQKIYDVDNMYKISQAKEDFKNNMPDLEVHEDSEAKEDTKPVATRTRSKKPPTQNVKSRSKDRQKTLDENFATRLVDKEQRVEDKFEDGKYYKGTVFQTIYEDGPNNEEIMYVTVKFDDGQEIDYKASDFRKLTGDAKDLRLLNR